STFKIERPAANLIARAFSTGAFSVRQDRFDLDVSKGIHEFAEIESAPALEHSLVTVSTAVPTGGLHGTLNATRDGAVWRISGSHRDRPIDVTIDASHRVPVVSIA